MKSLLLPAALSAALLAPLPAAASTASPSPSAGPSAGPSADTSPSASPRPTLAATTSPPPACLAYAQASPAPGTHHLYRSSDGGTLQVQPGHRVVVQFDCGDDAVTLPESSSLALRRTGGSVQPSGRGAQAFFDAVEPGSAVLSATFTPQCPGGPCGAPSRTWRVTVTVGDPQPCLTLAIAQGDDTATPDVRSRAGIPVALAYGTPRSSTATVTLTRTDPAPVAPVRQQRAVSGRVQFEVAPTVNTVLDARTDDPSCSPVVRRVLVEPTVSLSARRTATRTYGFTGRVFPARGQVVSLYRQSTRSSEAPVLTAQVRLRADGTYRIDRRFLRGGSFVFFTTTSAVPSNVAGSSVGVSTTVR